MGTKKRTYSFLLLVHLLYFISFATTSAQETDPSGWNSFVNSNRNITIRDTFKLNTFSDTPSIYNLEYTVAGNTRIIPSEDTNIPDASGGNLMILNPDSRIVVPLNDLEGHTNVRILAAYAAWNLSYGENLLITIERETKPYNKAEYLAPPQTGYNRSFRQRKEISLGGEAALIVNNNPSLVQLDVVRSVDQSEGFYALDSIYTYGDIKQHSYFTGNGNWHTKTGWSHQPAFRNRNALINGDIKVNKPTTCNELYIGNGSVHIAGEQQLTSNNILFCSNDAFLKSEGEIYIGEKATVYRSFPEKGRWYFISFPFDVYPDGIDPAFEFKDDTPNNGGNYFYLYQYNGDKRGQNQTATDNWEVVTAPQSPGLPLFEKGKGYLIALDEKATSQTIGFSSASGSIPADFGRNGTLSIVLSIYGKEDADQGWYLCGNPLPCPLSLSALTGTDDLDGYIYVYQDNDYTAYPLDEEYTLPPFSAFFVKAKKSCDITIQPSLNTKNQTMILSEPLSTIKAEPRASGSPVSLASSPAIKTSNSYLNVNSLFLEDLLTPGVIHIWDLGGRLYWKKEVNAGSSVIYLPSSLPSGNYIIAVETPTYRGQHLFNWNQYSFK